jgi:hypothetical protein
MLETLLLINAAFNFIVWPQFYRRIKSDPRARDTSGNATTFLKVHVVLISVALVIAAVSAVSGLLSLIGVW